MKLKLFAIYDTKTKAYLNPFVSLNEATASRSVSAAISSDPVFSTHPDDFSLWEVASFDSTSGEVESRTPLSCLGSLVQLVKS